MNRLLVASLFAIVVAATTSGAQGTDKTLILSVVDQSGAPVTNMTVEELALREDGVDADLLSLKPASGPLHVELLVDTTPGIEPFVNDIRKACLAFTRDILQAGPDNRITLTEFGQAAVAITPSTGSADELEKGINRIFPKPRSGSVLMEAINAASNNLANKPSRRRAIVSFNMEPSDEQSSQEPKKVNESLMRSGAQLWALSLNKGNTNPTRDVVLNQFAKNTGGHREIIVAQSAVETYLRRYAAALNAQYELTYRVKGSGRNARLVQTGTTREGVKLHASLFPPRPQ